MGYIEREPRVGAPAGVTPRPLAADETDLKKRRKAASSLHFRASVADRLALVELEETGRVEEQRRLLGQQRARTPLRLLPFPFRGDRSATPRRLTRDENSDLF